MHRYALAGALIAGLALAGCAKVTDNQEVFQASLSGANEVPARPTAATGTAQYVLDTESGTIFYTVEVNGLNNIILGHIHTGAAGANGGVIVSLIDLTGAAAPRPRFTTGSGILVEGTITRSTPLALGFTFDTLVAAMRTGATYTNFHTTAFPGGEVRGQVQPVNLN